MPALDWLSRADAFIARQVPYRLVETVSTYTAGNQLDGLHDNLLIQGENVLPGDKRPTSGSVLTQARVTFKHIRKT